MPNGGQEPAIDCTISASRLHVVLTADLLIVTEADDLHEPGRCISARQILGFSRWSMFQLLDTPAPGISFERHVAAAGIAVLTWQDRHRRLKVFGFAAGFPAEDDCIFDAIECDHC